MRVPKQPVLGFYPGLEHRAGTDGALLGMHRTRLSHSGIFKRTSGGERRGRNRSPANVLKVSRIRRSADAASSLVGCAGIVSVRSALGKSQMVPLNASAFVVLTGNGLTLSEDLARRFMVVDLDPRTEDPEARRFTVDIQDEVKRRRSEFLGALLTIWRWGRLDTSIEPGRAFGSFEQWCRWVRDPLLALGCQDPAERVGEAKERDGRRQVIAELFRVWWEKHGDQPIPVGSLHEEVRLAIDAQGRGRQYVASWLGKLAGTRMAGFALTRQAASGRWGAATYALTLTGSEIGPGLSS
jgi:hypothetical protein